MGRGLERGGRDAQLGGGLKRESKRERDIRFWRAAGVR